MKVVNEHTSIKEWYQLTYPSDELGSDIADITFYDLFELLDHRKEVYPYLAYDSIVRERMFEQLSLIMGCSYDYVYEQWLLGE